MQNKIIGKLGELIALKFLINQNHRKLVRNYRSRFGEIDLILIKNHKIIFVEVKTRTNNHFGEINETFAKSQKLRIIKSADIFFLENVQFQGLNWQIDLVTIKIDLNKGKHEVRHYKNIVDN